MVKRVLVLGSTGSVGQQTLDVLSELTATHAVVGLSAHTSAARLVEQARRTHPEAVCLTQPESATGLELPDGCTLLTGSDGLLELVERSRPDVVVCAITGAAGLPSTLAAAATGADLALANKESLVLAGHLVKRAARVAGGSILPVDSEHSAIAQCLAGQPRDGVRRIILTASGGPFHGWSAQQMRSVTVEQALRHPSWEMGPRITIDSATLVNKALEVIEACHLFDVTPDDIHVVVHRQSVVHSMVEFVDGAILAQLSPPDMRLPIRYALGHPGRVACQEPPVDITALSGLTFEEPDRETFPCLALGERAARAGGLAGTIFNAANEVAVEAFLAGRLAFTEIPVLIADALDHFEPGSAPDLETILKMDAEVRRHTALRLTQPAT